MKETTQRVLDAALEYQKRGFSVIPVRPAKSKEDRKVPLIDWREFQERKAIPEEIRGWSKKWPWMNIGLVTGSISGFDVFDVDSIEGLKAVEQFIPATYPTPAAISASNKGCHFYFEYQEGLTNTARVLPDILPDCDIRTNGGFIVVPPSAGYNGNYYQWQKGRSILEVPPAPWPIELVNILVNAFNRGIRGNATGSNNPLQGVTPRNISFDEGGRDEALFCLANHLVKSGMDAATIENYLYFFAENCNPPFPVKEVQAKIQSALKRSESKNRNLTQEVKDLLAVTWGNTSVTNICQALQVVTSADRAKCRVILKRLVDDENYPLERVEGKDGWYRKIENDCEVMDFLNASTESSNVWLPFGLPQMVETMPGNILLLAGEPNSGKTALLLNVIRSNMQKHEVHYFNSEMGSAELKKRLSNFDDLTLGEWKFKAWERSDSFADVIKPGKGKINIIDFLEIHENFYEIGGKLAEIHKKLKGAIAIVALQKNPGSDVGLGGFRTLEKPRLALSLSPNEIKIVKAKNWKGSENPNGKKLNFKLIAGCKLITTRDWYK